MAQLIIHPNSMFTIDTTVRESDPYSELVHIRFERHYAPEKIHGCDDFFLTPKQLELLGRFLVRQADEIRTTQELRKA